MPHAPLDLLLLPTWLVPVEPAGVVLHEHGLGIRDGRIALIAPRAEALQHAALQVLELPGRLLTPGLINAHGHAAMTLFRGLADDLPLNTWLEQHIWPAEAKWVNEQFVQDGTELAIAEQLKGLGLFDDLRHHPRLSVAFGPHAPYTVSDDKLENIRVLAEELDAGIHMHVHETDFEVQQSLEQHGERPLAPPGRPGPPRPAPPGRPV